MRAELAISMANYFAIGADISNIRAANITPAIANLFTEDVCWVVLGFVCFFVCFFLCMSIGSLYNILEVHKILQTNSRRASGTHVTGILDLRYF